MILVAVNASVGKQAENMHGVTCRDGLIDRGADVRILKEVAVTDGLGYPSEILIHHAACAQVHMTDFGVAHLAVRKAHIHTAAGNQTVRLTSEQAIINRLVGSMDGVEFGIVAMSEAIENHQYQGFGRGRHVSGSLHEGAKNGGQSTGWPVWRHDSQGSARLRGCVYWPAFYPPGTLINGR